MANKLYANYQYTINLVVGEELVAATETKIRIRQPLTGDNEIIELDATITDIATGTLTATVSASQNDSAGVVSAWAYVNYADGNDQVGIPYVYRIYNEGY